jgi:hypothetical protein
VVFRRERNAVKRSRLELRDQLCVPSRPIRLSCGLADLFDRVCGSFVLHHQPAVRGFAIKADRRIEIRSGHAFALLVVMQRAAGERHGDEPSLHGPSPHGASLGAEEPVVHSV